MDDITELFEAVFPGCRVYEDDKAALQAEYSYIKTWTYGPVTEHIAGYISDEPSQEPWRLCKFLLKRVHPDVCEYHGGCRNCVKNLMKGDSKACEKQTSKRKSVKQSSKQADSPSLYGKAR
jgi:hypothetical protein